MSEVIDEGPVVDNDPFSPNNIGFIQFIQLSRIYDVLLGIYTHLDSKAATELLNVHLEGGLMGPEPRYSGLFVTDEINPMEETDDSTGSE